MTDPPDPLERARADLEAARELVRAKDAELAVLRALAARLSADAVLTRQTLEQREGQVARLRAVEPATGKAWLKAGLRLLVGEHRFAAGQRLYGMLLGRRPPATEAAPPLGQLAALEGHPLLDLLACPHCGHAPLVEGWARLECPRCACLYPVVDSIPIFSGVTLEQVIRPEVLEASPASDSLRAALRQRLGRAGLAPGPPPGEVTAGPPAAVRPGLDAPTLPLPGPARPGTTRVLFVSHNLNLEGASLFQLWLAQALPRDRFEILVLTPTDGMLRHRYEAAGIPVSITDLFRHTDGWAEYGIAAPGLARWIRLAAFDLVFANTLLSFWAVAAARLAGRPVVWKIHESVDWRTYFDYLAPRVRAEAIQCLKRADALTFTADTTRKLFADFETADRLHTIYCGLDAPAIDAYTREHSRAAVRAAHGLSDADRVVSVVGTTCERKGQVDFVRMAAALRRTRPADRLRFYVVGAREGEYLERLRGIVREEGLDTVQLVDETPDVYPYYRMADIFVCPSYRESFPLVVLEAMAFALPIVATAVFGIPEAVTDGREALLTAPGDVAALAQRVTRLLDDPELAQRLRANARATFSDRFTLDRMAAEYARLFDRIAPPRRRERPA